MFHLTRLLAAVALAASTITASLIAAPAVANAGGPSCPDTFAFGVGGFQIDLETFPPNLGQPSLYIPNTDQPVGYNSIDINDGVRELNKLFWEYRGRCPGSHIKILGHSGGAAVVHVWVSQHQDVPNATAILVSDPKRAAGPGGDGLAGNPLAGPAEFVGIFSGAAGTDADFGDFPVLTICNAGDWVCNEDAGPHGYLHTGVHGAYDINPWSYPNFIRGNWFPEVY